jgi:mannose-6-phosphate isomerase-like protein (cupin superfamily)
MQEGAAGPAHVFDAEQVWSVVQGSARVEVEGVVTDLGAGDTVVLPAGAVRQMTATTRLRVVACSEGTATVSVPGEEGFRGTPPWIR